MTIFRLWRKYIEYIAALERHNKSEIQRRRVEESIETKGAFAKRQTFPVFIIFLIPHFMLWMLIGLAIHESMKLIGLTEFAELALILIATIGWIAHMGLSLYQVITILSRSE